MPRLALFLTIVFAFQLHQVALLVASPAPPDQPAETQAELLPQSPIVHPQAHAHNDYAHDRPLHDALANGFSSVEADIFLVDGQLLVGHERSELRPDRTLEDLYLEPLRKIVAANGGHVYQQPIKFQLLIDIKTEGVETYNQLSKTLAKYKDFLTEVSEGIETERAVSVVISGNRPIELISQQAIRFAAIDGRLSDLDSSSPSHLIPLISDRWGSHFSWKGAGEMPREQFEKLQGILHKAHVAGRKVRFWATPDNVEMWRFLNDVGVDYINTDDLVGLASMLN